jgi:signal peptidase II
MKNKHILLLFLLLILADQVLKIWVKTHMTLDQSIIMIPNWFQLRFVENNGAAFGMHIASGNGFDWGKLLLSLFRFILIGLLGYYTLSLHRRKAPIGLTIGLTLILAGAVGNMIDSSFYGLIFSESGFHNVAHWGNGYAPFMLGRVVDMFYFPLFQWNSVPRCLSFLVDSHNYFFGAIFNLADAYISVAVVYLLIFQYKFFK